MVAAGEETASLDTMLRKAAEFVDAQAAEMLHRALALPTFTPPTSEAEGKSR